MLCREPVAARLFEILKWTAAGGPPPRLPRFPPARFPDKIHTIGHLVLAGRGKVFTAFDIVFKTFTRCLPPIVLAFLTNGHAVRKRKCGLFWGGPRPTAPAASRPRPRTAAWLPLPCPPDLQQRLLMGYRTVQPRPCRAPARFPSGTVSACAPVAQTFANVLACFCFPLFPAPPERKFAKSAGTVHF